MGGKRQHYIPRFLQRGFLDGQDVGAERTWLHTRGTEPRLVGIRDVGVGEEFYSKLSADGSKTLDELITELESGPIEDLSTIKRIPVGDLIDPAIAVRLVAHFTVRTAHLRTSFEQVGVLLFDEATALFSDPVRLREYLGLDNSGTDAISAQICEELLRSVPFATSNVPSAFVERLVAYLVRERFDEFYRTIGPTAIQAFTDLRQKLSWIIRGSHNNALVRAMPDLGGWAKGLPNFTWRTHTVDGAVLPDCVVLAREPDRGFTPYLLSDKNKLDLVVLPVAHDLLLVGSPSSSYEIDISSINIASASCSDRFFISYRSERGNGLSSLIGERCSQVISESLGEALSSLRNSEARNPPEQQTATYVIDVESPTTFSVTCIGFADEETASELGKVLQTIVFELARSLPLSKLDGMTFSRDYTAAVAGIDRGDPVLEPCLIQERNYGRAVAKCLTVVRESERKEHIVFDAVIADQLLSGEPALRSSAAHIIVSMLAQVAHTEIWEERLAGAKLESVDEVHRLLHGVIATVPGNYYCAKESAFVDPGAGERYATLVLDSLKDARDAIRAARLAYRQSNDLDELLRIALSRSSFVLGHTAEWLGHRDGLPTRDTFPGAVLASDLTSSELHLWLELFGRDLRNLYDIEGQFTPESVFALARHAERLLWTFQICPWLTETGHVYVSVPMGDDTDILSSQPNDRAEGQ